MRPSRGASRTRGRRVVQRSAPLGGPHDSVGHDNISNFDHDRRMELIASVSRSSGLEKDGDL